ncbi:TetR family transcriptional regulator C-terminal domain-containing protein [Paracoccus homiensis]|uniref:Transcriptional regulator, TetR family n=1 Tax=Paracoccus homiensis TaxID=364199 RepID=A0A1I0GYK7_9RHOB|nr:TetR family transcriptional regulator C-terminal domain-containing protein [Paracoccus homiensis]SET76504.1 transcriptional regulator, TetR family [Paracoccus homiensis]
MSDNPDQPLTRIQRQNRQIILQGALTAFSTNGFRGATIDQIAEAAGLSKPNVFYYFGSKDEIHRNLLTGLLDMWLAPLVAINPDGQPLDEVLTYVRAKLDMSRDYPRESRLFAYEVMRGAPHLTEILSGRLRNLVEDTVTLLRRWMDEGRLARVEPHHLIFSIWSMTQHYADFEVQVQAVLGPGHDPYAEAGEFLDQMYRRMLAV